MTSVYNLIIIDSHLAPCAVSRGGGGGAVESTAAAASTTSVEAEVKVDDPPPLSAEAVAKLAKADEEARWSALCQAACAAGKRGHDENIV